jgi:hypothetical protein
LFGLSTFLPVVTNTSNPLKKKKQEARASPKALILNLEFDAQSV